jgi:hypothetical protein
MKIDPSKMEGFFIFQDLLSKIQFLSNPYPA